MQALMAAKAKEKGMAEAPAVVQAAGLKCNVVDARLIGQDKQHGSFYEVDCGTGLGYVLQSVKDTPPLVFNCLEAGRPAADGTPSTISCELPGNLDTIGAVQKFVAKTDNPCVVDKARAMGQNKKSSFIEVSCKNGGGYIVTTSNPPDLTQPVQIITCLASDPNGNLACEMTDEAAQLAPVNALVAKSEKTCNISGRRYVLTTTSGSNFYEVACDNGRGYMIEENAKRELARMVDCSKADFVGGGCTLTDSRAAETEQAALYSKLATKSGFNCDVAKYAVLPTTGPKEIIELQCKNRPDGGIGVFTASGGHVYDCVRADVLGFRCSFSKTSAVYPKLTGDLKKLGKPSCEVSDTRSFGATTDEDFVEVACADGDPGWVIGYPKENDTPKEVLSCGQAASFGTGGCRLATNRKR
jgi:hypothetical protein